MEQSPRSATGLPTNQHRPTTALSETGSGRRRSGIGPSCENGSRHTTPMFSCRIGSIVARSVVGPCVTRNPRHSAPFLPEYRLFSVEVVLGAAEREKFEARRYGWRSQLVKLYDEARTYPDGKWLKIAISSAADRHDVTELLSLKRPPPRSRD